MAFPSAPTRAAQSFSSSTNHNVNMPATVLVGRLLLLFFDSGSATATTPSGWTQKGVFDNGGSRRAYLFAKIANGSEGGTTVNVVTSVANGGMAITYYYPDAGFSLTDVAISTGVTGNSANPNPPSLAHGWGSIDATYLAAMNGGTIGAFPTSYTNGQTVAGFGLGTAERNVTGTSTDPGTFTCASTTWIAFTVAIRAPTPVVISSVTPTTFPDGQTGIVIVGTGFNATQSTGGVELADNATYAAATKVGQTETAWSATSITITAVKGALPYGTLYVFVTSSSGSISNGYAVTLTEPVPPLPDPANLTGKVEAVLYTSGGAQLGAITDLITASIKEPIGAYFTATFSAPLSAAGVALATVGTRIDIIKAGLGIRFRGYIAQRSSPIDENGITIVNFVCASLAWEIQRRQTFRSILLLDQAGQSSADELLEDTGWTALITGAFSNTTKDFVNISRLKAISEFAAAKSAYWRQTHNLRELEIKNYHSPSGIVLTNVEEFSVNSRLGFLNSITQLDEDVSGVLNRLAMEIKTDSNRLITLQEATRTSPYTIQSMLQRMPRVVSFRGSIVLVSKFSTAFTTLGENRYVIALLVANVTDDTAASVGGQIIENLAIGVSGANTAVWGGVNIPKGTPVIDFDVTVASPSLAVVTSLENVDQINPVKGRASNSGSSTTPSVSVTSDVNSTVIAILVMRTIGTPSVTPTASQELVGKVPDTPFDENMMTVWKKSGGATTTSFTWTISPSQAWEAYAVALNPSKTYYIEDTDSQNLYGISEDVVSLDSFAEVEEDNENLANTAYDYLVDYIDKVKNPPKFYACKAAYLPGSPLDWLPGETIRVINQSATQPIDEDLIVVDRTETYDANSIPSWELVVSNKPQMPIDQLTILQKLLAAVRATKANQV